MLIHKDTFFQDANGGIPSHWAVQYYDTEGDGFPCTNYFTEEAEARNFEETLRNEETINVND